MFIIETCCVLCEVGTGVLLSPTANHSVLVSFPAQSDTSEGESDTGTYFSSSNSVFIFQCHSAIAPSSPEYLHHIFQQAFDNRVTFILCNEPKYT